MGWWDESIYGGDDSIIWKEKIYKTCNTQEYGEDQKTQPIPRETLESKIQEIRTLIDKSDEGDNNINIGYQVLGAILMHAGFDLDESEGLKERIILAAEEDNWSKEHPVRDNVMKNFKKLIKEYDFSEPVNILQINVFEENEDDDEEIAKEFKEVFGILNGRIKKLESMVAEDSGNKDYNEGFEAAAQEELDFLKDFKELLGKQEMMGILLERINKGLIDSNPLSNTKDANKSSSPASSGGKDVMAG